MRILKAVPAVVLTFVCLSNSAAHSQNRRRPTAPPSSPQDTAPKRPVTVTVRSGAPLVGNFIQADANTIQIEVNGARQSIKIDDVISLAFINPASPTQAETTRAINPQDYVKSEYDAAKDETRVELRYMSVYGDSRHALGMGMAATFKGRSPASFPQVTIGFLSVSNDWQYEAFHDRIGTGKGVFRVLVDGRPLSLVQEGYNTYRKPSVNEGKAIEQITVMPRLSTGFNQDDMTKIADAQRVDMQLAYTRFVLSDENLAAVREFVRRITPALETK